MQTINLSYNHKEYTDKKINGSLDAILRSTTLFSVATVKAGNISHIHTAFFCYSPNLNLYFLTPPTTQHSRNVEKNPSIAVSIFDSHQKPSDKKRGLQILGNCRLAIGKDFSEGIVLYSKRFNWTRVIESPQDLIKAGFESKLYVIKPSSIKIFDEVIFGEEKWVTVNVKGGKI